VGPAAELLRGGGLLQGAEALWQVHHGKADGIPQLVAPVAVRNHTLNVKIDVTSLQGASTHSCIIN
jgi:hypothetical protein